MEPEGSLPHSQVSTTCHCPEDSINPGPRLSVWIFRNKLCFYGEKLLAPRPTQSWKTTTCQLSATAYSIYFQLSSLLEAVHPQPEDA